MTPGMVNSLFFFRFVMFSLLIVTISLCYLGSCGISGVVNLTIDPVSRSKALGIVYSLVLFNILWCGEIRGCSLVPPRVVLILFFPF